MADEETPSVGGKPSAGVAAVIVGIGLIVVYLAFVGLLWRDAGRAADLSWPRRSGLLTGLEVLAFTAAGTVLGTTVQRQATKRAEKEAERSRAQARLNEADAEKGRALEAALQAKVTAAPAAAGRVDAGLAPRGGTHGAGSPSSAADLEELLELARQYSNRT